MNVQQEQFESDPQLDAQLDQALAPDAVPGGLPSDLANRILKQTMDELPTPHRSVLARIGPYRIFAVAAMVALVACLCIVLLDKGPTHEIDQMVNTDAAIDEIDEIEDALAKIDESYELDELDQKIETLTLEIDQFTAQDMWEVDTFEQELKSLERQF